MQSNAILHLGNLRTKIEYKQCFIYIYMKTFTKMNEKLYNYKVQPI